MNELTIIVNLILKVVVSLAALGGLIGLGAWIAKASRWAGKLDEKLDAGFKQNAKDHRELKESLDEHSATLASHALELTEHRVRITGLEKQIYKQECVRNGKHQEEPK